MVAWRSLDLLEFEGEVVYSRGHLYLIRDGVRAGEVPLEDLELVILGLKVRLGGSVIQMLNKYDVVVVPCGWDGVPTAAIAPWAKHSRTGLRQLCQVVLTVPRQKRAWKAIVRAKILGQSATISTVSLRVAHELRRLASEVRSGDSTNVEARAARIYWAALFGDEEFTRDRFSRDFRNSALNYGYTILRGHCVRAIVAAGLWPGLGIWHRGRANAFSLADDLIEPFRSAIDYVVMSEPLNGEGLTKETRQRLAAALQLTFDYASGRSIAAEVTHFAQHMGRYFEGDEENLQAPVWKLPRGRI